jgi:hypothetical protein
LVEVEVEVEEEEDQVLHLEAEEVPEAHIQNPYF